MNLPASLIWKGAAQGRLLKKTVPIFVCSFGLTLIYRRRYRGTFLHRTHLVAVAARGFTLAGTLMTLFVAPLCQAQIFGGKFEAIKFGLGYNSFQLERTDTHSGSVIFADNNEQHDPLAGYSLNLGYANLVMPNDFADLHLEVGLNLMHLTKSESLPAGAQSGGVQVSRQLSIQQWNLYSTLLFAFDMDIVFFYCGLSYDFGLYGDAYGKLSFNPELDGASQVVINYGTYNFGVYSFLLRFPFTLEALGLIEVDVAYFLSSYKLKQLSATADGNPVNVTNDPNEGRGISMSGWGLRLLYVLQP